MEARRGRGVGNGPAFVGSGVTFGQNRARHIVMGLALGGVQRGSTPERGGQGQQLGPGTYIARHVIDTHFAHFRPGTDIARHVIDTLCELSILAWQRYCPPRHRQAF